MEETNRRSWLLTTAVIVLGIAATLIPGMSARLSHEFDPSDPNNTIISPDHLWQVTLQMLRDHPIFGTGLFGFARSIQPYRGGGYQENPSCPTNRFPNFWT